MKNNEIEISNVKYKIIYFSPKKQDKKDISDLIQNSTYITSIPLSIAYLIDSCSAIPVSVDIIKLILSLMHSSI